MDAVILAGGMGTRLRPLTDTRPKPLVPFMGDPFAFGLLRRLIDAGVTRATFLVGAEATPFRPLVDAGPQLGITVELLTEEVPLDTAGAARRLFRRIRADGPVLVCNGDILTDVDLGAALKAHETAGAAATIVLTRVSDTSSFGVVVCAAPPGESGPVSAFVEKPLSGTIEADTVNAGTYVLDPDAFVGFPGDGPLSFERDVFPGLVAAGHPVIGFPSTAAWHDLGTPRRYLDGHRAVLAGECDWPVDPELKSIGPLGLAHASAVVHADANVGDSVVIGRDCFVAAGAVLTDSVLYRGVRIGPGAQVRSAVLGEAVMIGAGAVVGPDAVLGDGVSVPDHGLAP